MVSLQMLNHMLEGKPTNDVDVQSVPDSRKRLALSIIDFLSTSLKDGTLTADDAENVEVASNCIAEAFKVDPNDKAAVSDAVGTQSLFSIYSVYEKLKGKSTASTTGPSSASEARPSTPSVKAADAKPPTSGSTINPEAEKLKSVGNSAMQQKDYKTAIAKYTEAISYAPTNPIYLSNRAAAYSASGDHVAAAADAEIAVASDPKYTKAWSRLGLAKFAMGDAKGSAEAYQKGIEYEGNGGSDAMKKGLETAKKRVAEMEEEEGDLPEDDVDDASGASGGGGMPDLASLAGMFGGGGRGGGGGGGMPDLAGLMNNPMFAGMARNLMQNPEALSGLMNNPRISEMMQGMQGGSGGGGGGGGGGMPDMSRMREMMSDPAIANL